MTVSETKTFFEFSSLKYTCIDKKKDECHQTIEI